MKYVGRGDYIALTLTDFDDLKVGRDDGVEDEAEDEGRKEGGGTDGLIGLLSLRSPRSTFTFAGISLGGRRS